MAITLQTFASGITDYISRFNSNFSIIKAAIDSLQVQTGGTGSLATIAAFLSALFDDTTTIIGIDGYAASGVGSNLTVTAGGAFRASSLTVVQVTIPTVISFVGQPAGTHYIEIDPLGIPVRTQILGVDALYSVGWTGAAFGTITKLAQVMFDAAEEEAARISTATSPPTVYVSLDARLEAIETDLTALLFAKPIRKVGVAFDNLTGIKGLIQVDFDGTIIGWSVIADASGSLEIEISVIGSSAPPATPQIPDPVADKITASAPIALSSSQSASGGTAAVSTWIISVSKWDVIQFKLASVSGGVTKGAAYIRIQET